MRCKIKLPQPQLAGYETWESLKKAAEQYPHLRPCPRHEWNWGYRKSCEKCKNAVKDDE